MKLTLKHAVAAIVLMLSFAAPVVAGPDEDGVRMEREGGVYVVPVRINDSITLNAIVDSGAGDVSIPADVVLTLMRTKTVSPQDFLGKQIYVLADGTRVPSQQFRIRSLKVGNKTIRNVTAGIASVKGDMLLGQSFLSRFKSWSIDNEKHVLMLGQPTGVSIKSREPTALVPQDVPVESGGYSVQVSSQKDEANALAAYQNLQVKFPNILGGRKPIIHRVDFGERGIYYRVHVGPFSANEAGELCSRLKGAGGMCIVQRE
jgi:Aspartyl protease/SPOR domain